MEGCKYVWMADFAQVELKQEQVHRAESFKDSETNEFIIQHNYQL